MKASFIAVVLFPVWVSSVFAAAPASRERDLITQVHCDVVNVSFGEGTLALGSQADLEGQLGVPVDPEVGLFNVEEAARTQVPGVASYAFLGEEGSDVWIAPESNPNGALLWPGFKTEGVPAGVLDENEITLRLQAVEGPGEFQLYQTTPFGEPVRLLSSEGTELREWTLPAGVHAHASWAFTAAGRYTLTFRASARVDGAEVSATQDYHFHVGEVPEALQTTTDLVVSAPEITRGSELSLTAAVSPLAAGYVEFYEGTKLLGHAPVVSGTALFATSELLLGVRPLSARFVPAWLDEALPSQSASVAVTVRDESGAVFSLSGIAASYSPGETVRAQADGYALGENEELRWRARHSESGETTWRLISGTDRWEQEVDASWQGVSVWAQIYHTGDNVVVAETARVELVVPGWIEAPTLTWLNGPEVFLGDQGLATVNAPAGLQEGDELVGAFRQGGFWLPEYARPIVEGLSLTHNTLFNSSGQVHIHVVREGQVIAMSQPYPTKHLPREVLIQGARGIYREGQSLRVSATVYPPSEELTYTWRFTDGAGNRTSEEVVPDEDGNFAFERSLTLADDGGELRLSTTFPTSLGFESGAGHAAIEIHVSDAGPGEQLVALDSLADHYHQGNTIHLNLQAEPSLAENDAIHWEWRWPEGNWAPLPGIAGETGSLVAEQALSGAEVRVRVLLAATGEEFVTNGVVIDVDDHGAPPLQQLALTGDVAVTAGDLVIWQAQVTPGSLLASYRWERKLAGEGEFTILAEETAATLQRLATLALDGAQFRFAVINPLGEVAYGPSEAGTLAVAPLQVTRPQLTLTAGESGWSLGMAVPDAASYQLQFSRNLQEGSWQNVGETFSGGGDWLLRTVPADSPRGFYRLREVTEGSASKL
ncbi:choice-of-anchor M domain-containing protein [Roseibacillus ishigakijimensis]|uniref:Choice-of-anchor M domain-containing protein n=1 Tax=Roseibacillus ishigakijimensis TaxID=454146 RepID=A0A934RQV3_9BACT|nr:choice-of-anchor M domain-containing protein [Roseibacillus ishigakijimensis]MBK1832866.1 choice-of-anchor M domain-containing protein [Roseibacillus ishigakijimensis]